MEFAKETAKSQYKTLGRLFPTLAGALDNAKSAARLETLEILMDIEQVSDLLSSFDEARQGRIVNMNSAFGDL